MTHGLRSIAFLAELVHPPVQHDPRALQRLHATLFGSAVSGYRDFRLVAGGAQLSNAVGGLPGAPVSVANVLADRIQIREEATGLSRDDFVARVAAVAESAMGALPLHLFMAQQFCVRSVANPETSDDARAFVLSTVLGYDEALMAPFATLPSLSGLRFTFPPAPDSQAIYNVRIESYSQDNRSLFIENTGTFGRPVTGSQLGELTSRFDATYDFLQDKVVEFVSQFDCEEL